MLNLKMQVTSFALDKSSSILFAAHYGRFIDTFFKYNAITVIASLDWNCQAKIKMQCALAVNNKLNFRMYITLEDTAHWIPLPA